MNQGRVITLAVLLAAGVLPSTAPAGAAPVTSEKVACDVAKARVAARGHFPVSAIAFCDFITSEEQSKDLYVLGLHGKRDDCGDDVCGSTLMGWFAVEKSTGLVFEWDFTDFPGKLGAAVTTHH
ncbi:hypothetical protein GCM10023264_18000 [Sphingomonas daechungensis]|uniref:hypothetical protein n=1 Tax=Sphingomonas daechungensis TaxID=1176646 RepID=UPI0031EF60A1